MGLDSLTTSDVMDDVIAPTIENDEAELLIVASTQTLKRKNERCGRDEVFELVKDSTDNDTVTKETFDKLLNQLINSSSVKLNTIGNREFESLKKIYLKEVIHFKIELLQSSIEKTPENHSERLIGHLESKPDSHSPERIKGKRSARKFIIRPNIQM